MKPIKTRHAYGEYTGQNPENAGKIYDLGDTVQAALKANMMVRDYEAQLVAANPQLRIIVRIEAK